jgi:hypothetical protein
LLDTILAIANLALAIASLIPVWQDKRVRVTLPLTLLLLTSGFIVWRRVDYERGVSAAQSKIVNFVTSQLRSEDDINEELHLTQPTVVSDALSRCEADGTVAHRLIPVTLPPNNTSVIIRVYYRPSSSSSDK